jgi:hypothetical protein
MNSIAAAMRTLENPTYSVIMSMTPTTVPFHPVPLKGNLLNLERREREGGGGLTVRGFGMKLPRICLIVEINCPNPATTQQKQL